MRQFPPPAWSGAAAWPSSASGRQSQHGSRASSEFPPRLFPSVGGGYTGRMPHTAPPTESGHSKAPGFSGSGPASWQGPECCVHG